MASAHESLLIVWDVGEWMAKRPDECAHKAREAVLMLVQNKIQFCPKDEVGVVLLGTRLTSNPLGDRFPGQYRHMTLLQPLRPPDLAAFRRLGSVTYEGAPSDVVDGLILATDLMVQHKGAKGGAKRIFLVTDAAGESKMAMEDVSKVGDTLKAQGISLFTIGVDFQPFVKDEEYETISDAKRRLEVLLYHMCEYLDGVVIPLQSALQALAQLRARTVRQVTTFRGVLEIAGDGSSSSGEFGGMGIRLWGYVKTRATPLPSLRKASAKAREARTGGDGAVIIDRRYFSQENPDAEVESGKRIKAYRYGRSLIPFGAVDEQVLKYETIKSLKLVGFTPKATVRHADLMGQSYIFAPPPGDAAAAAAVTALVHALRETETVAIVRYVRCRNAQPLLGALLPQLKPDRCGFHFAALPFSEDLRQYPFPSAREVKARLRTVERDKLAAVHDLVASMDLMTAAPDGTEALKPKAVFNPCLQHLYQAVRHRALHPGAPLVDLDPAIAAYARAWDAKGVLRGLLDRAQPALDKVRALFPLQPVETDRPRKRYWFAVDAADIDLTSYAKAKGLPEADLVEPEPKRLKGNYFDPSGSGAFSTSSMRPSLVGVKVPLDDLLSTKVSQVGTVHPVKDFQAMIARRDEDLVDKAVAEMQAVIRQLLRDSIADQYYDKAGQCVEALRAGCILEDEGRQFNDFLRTLKAECSAGRRSDFWDSHVKAKRVTLICDDEADVAVSQAEAARFLEEAPLPPAAAQVVREASEGDLFEDVV